ncbi:MAG: MBL fold metallo-hydrolase [Planctomycetota bacterium]
MARPQPLFTRGLFDALDQPDPPMRAMTLASGSSGNATYVHAGNTRLLVDAGIEKKHIAAALETHGASIDQLDAVIVTHAHGDHIGGLRAVVNQSRAIVMASRPVLRSARRLCKTDLSARSSELRPGWKTAVGCIEITPVRTSHDAPGSLGVMLSAGGRRLAVLTDLGCVDDATRQLIRACDVAILEANFDVQMLEQGPYPPYLKRRVAGDRGHLSNDDAAALIATSASSRLQRVICAHLSQENNLPELALRALQSAVDGVQHLRHVHVSVAPRREPSELFHV